jgi:hypothetical protein
MKKSILTIATILLTVSAVQSQSINCDNYSSSATDKMTGKTTNSSKEVLIVSEDAGITGFGIIMLDLSETFVISIEASGAGSCIDEKDRIIVLFRDGTRIELKNDGKFNCDRKFTLYFGKYFGKNKELQMFKTKEIETIRIWTSNSYVEKDFSKENSIKFMNTVSCLTNNFK